MALTVWTKSSGYSFGIFQERIVLDLPLPVSGDSGVTYDVISGALPGGLRIVGNHITGTPFEVARETEFSFCIRASKAGEISDRTFKISIQGADGPEFITPEGELDVGTNHQYFALDSSYVNYQIQAVDFDTAVGQKLTFFISGGELPPGLILTDDGRIVGFVQPALSIKPEDGDGTYDNTLYDNVAFDFAYRPTNGYDSYIFDSKFFDYSLASSLPKKLNRNYEFVVSVTDGDVVSRRTFKIFVVGDDYFRADNTVWLTDSGLFTADVTYLRAPIWITSADLGTYRANNYITIKLDTYDTNDVLYSLVTPNGLPPGMNFDQQTADIYGRVPYQPAITKTYTFTVTATRISEKINIAEYAVDPVNAGSNLNSIVIDRITYPDIVNVLDKLTSINIDGRIIDPVYISSIDTSVPTEVTINLSTPVVITSSTIVLLDYVASVGEEAVSSRTFTLRIIGEVDSVITWDTDPDLGSINANFVSTLSVSATTTIPNAIVLYTVTSGSLPPGLSLDLSGEIVGKVNQFANLELGTLGLTTFNADQTLHPTSSGDPTTFDAGTTTVDRVYTFTVQARDITGYSATTRTFTITVDTPNTIVYSNIRTRPFLPMAQRALWQDFINNPSVFTPSSIYRSNDPSFGVQTELNMIVYAGIETTEAAKYISAMGLNHKRKRFQFGEVKKAVAYNPGTTTPVYEVVYVEMIDPLEINGKRLPNKLERLGLQSNTITVDNSNALWSRRTEDLVFPAPDAQRPNPFMTIDSTGYQASNANPGTYYPNSISNWQDNIQYWTDDNGNGLASERNYLPLWMRSIQPGSKQELGFQLAVPLCFCKNGTADAIVLNIKNYLNTTNFKFNLIDYTVDRFIIDSVTGTTSDKYLVFRNDRITV